MSPLPASIVRLRAQIETLVAQDIAPRAAETDRLAAWPSHSFEALRKAGLLGLNVPRSAEGMGEGLLALAVATEAIGQGCASSAICYGMHCVGSAVIAAKATPQQRERYLIPIARGEHITTLSLSETGTGALFYLPETTLSLGADGLEVNGTKQFVTNAEHADSYVISTQTLASTETGDFSCLILDKETSGMEWLAPWSGLGMRGNSARGLQLRKVDLPKANLLGQEGDQIWYIFEVVAPYFLMAMAGTYLGVAQAALNETVRHLKNRIHTPTGDHLADLPTIQTQVADLWTKVERTRQWIHRAAQAGDQAEPGALPLILGAKVEAAETAVAVTNEAMTLCGGIAYRENADLARYLRDARASHVMSPTTGLLKLWIGRAVLGQSLL